MPINCAWNNAQRGTWGLPPPVQVERHPMTSTVSVWQNIIKQTPCWAGFKKSCTHSAASAWGKKCALTSIILVHKAELFFVCFIFFSMNNFIVTVPWCLVILIY
jgi:hypothetical protein